MTQLISIGMNFTPECNLFGREYSVLSIITNRAQNTDENPYGFI